MIESYSCFYNHFVATFPSVLVGHLRGSVLVAVFDVSFLARRGCTGGGLYICCCGGMLVGSYSFGLHCLHIAAAGR